MYGFGRVSDTRNANAQQDDARGDGNDDIEDHVEGDITAERGRLAARAAGTRRLH
jgi:hypothetical protein